MKKLIIIMAAIVFTFSSNIVTFAHSHIGETVPADGEVITEKLSEIVLNFDGKIELGSTIELFDSKNNKIELNEIKIENSQLIGKLNDNLLNDEYKVEWSIISADGHPLQGTYSFTINVEEEPVTEEKETVQTKEVEIIKEDASENKSETQNSSTVWIALGIAAVILLLGAIIFFKRKK